MVTVADTSVWIDMLQGHRTMEVSHLESGLREASIAVGDLIAMEVLQGLRSDPGGRIRAQILALEIHEMTGLSLCLAAARNYGALRARGFTIRSSVDCLIATYCIQGGHTLLHSDRDFDPFEQHLGLRVLRA